MSASECNEPSQIQENQVCTQSNENNGCTDCTCICRCHNANELAKREADSKKLGQCSKCRCLCVCEKDAESKRCPKCLCDCNTCTPDKCCCEIAKEQIKKASQDPKNATFLSSIASSSLERYKMNNAVNYLGLIIYNARDNAAGKFRNTVMLNSNVIKAYGRGEIFAQCIESSLLVKRGRWGSAGFGFVTFNTEADAHSFFNTTIDFSDWYWMNQSDIHVIGVMSKLLSVDEMPYVCLDLVEFKHEYNECGMSSSDINRLRSIVSSCGGNLIAATDCIRRERGSKSFAFVAITQWRDVASFEKFHSSTSKNEGDGTCCLRLFSQMESFVKNN